MVEQGTPEWMSMRLGKATASRMADITAKTKTGWGASRANYMAQIVAERLTGVPAESYSSPAMQWGSATEPEARAAYEFYSGRAVALIDFVDHPTIAMSGASPDGLVGDCGLIEIKCPNTATHIETLLGEAIPEKYLKQMHWQMACTGRAWCDFVSYDPRMPEDLRLFVKRVTTVSGVVAELEDHVRVFLKEVDAKVSALNALRQAEAAE